MSTTIVTQAAYRVRKWIKAQRACNVVPDASAVVHEIRKARDAPDWLVREVLERLERQGWVQR